MSLANGITPANVARRIAALIVGDENKGSAAEPIAGQLAALAASHVGDDVATMDAADREAGVEAVLRRTRHIEGPL